MCFYLVEKNKNMISLSDHIVYRKNFFSDHQDLFDHLVANIDWVENMKSRKTACFGKPYDYAEQTYEFKPMISVMEDISLLIEKEIGFKPNNCLLNYYPNGKSKMGFHGDTTKMLVPDTGIAIVSLGDNRIMQVRRTKNPTEMYHYILPGGSLFYMSNAMQVDWQHGLPKVVDAAGRISLTFRQMS